MDKDEYLISGICDIGRIESRYLCQETGAQYNISPALNVTRKYSHCEGWLLDQSQIIMMLC